MLFDRRTVSRSSIAIESASMNRYLFAARGIPQLQLSGFFGPVATNGDGFVYDDDDSLKRVLPSSFIFFSPANKAALGTNDSLNYRRLNPRGDHTFVLANDNRKQPQFFSSVNFCANCRNYLFSWFCEALLAKRHFSFRIIALIHFRLFCFSRSHTLHLKLDYSAWTSFREAGGRYHILIRFAPSTLKGENVKHLGCLNCSTSGLNCCTAFSL